MTAVTALILGSVLGYFVTPQLRAFGYTTVAVLVVLVFQSIVLHNAGEDLDNWVYPTVQVGVVGLAFLTTSAGARLRAHRDRGPMDVRNRA